MGTLCLNFLGLRFQSTAQHLGSHVDNQLAIPAKQVAVEIEEIGATWCKTVQMSACPRCSSIGLTTSSHHTLKKNCFGSWRQVMHESWELEFRKERLVDKAGADTWFGVRT
jgi:hypothetical protein